MAYLFLGLAIVCELIATTLLKQSTGFTKLMPTLGCIVFYVTSFYCLSKALEEINLGIAYATWSGVGIVATTLISAHLFHQGVSLAGVIGLIMIISGCIVLNLFGNVH